MITLREAAQQALEALESLFNWQVDPDRGKRCSDAITALRAALAQEEQEPVVFTGDVARRMREAEMTFHLGMPHAVVMQQMTRFHDLVCAEASLRAAAAFAIPPRREWQSLSEQERHRLWRKLGEGEGIDEYARAIEAKLKEKNNG